MTLRAVQSGTEAKGFLVEALGQPQNWDAVQSLCRRADLEGGNQPEQVCRPSQGYSHDESAAVCVKCCVLQQAPRWQRCCTAV